MPDSSMYEGKFQILVLSGPSGSGKTTIVERLVAQSPVPLIKVISATTRPQRKGEVDGIAYYFLTSEEFGVIFWRRQRFLVPGIGMEP